jgi:osmotically-inducible protein OsmY
MRTDNQLQHEVLAELQSALPTLAPTLGVEVHAGVVVLTGIAQTDEQRVTAERVAQRVDGVQALDDEIALASQGLRTRSDAEIGRAVHNLLFWKTYSSHERLKVTVARGWVTLSGEVERRYQRQNVNEAIRALIGVRGLTDQVAVQSPNAATAAQNEIRAALNRRSEIDARDIDVQVLGAEVTLTGTVHSARERALACETAWNAPGVRKVWDQLQISP